MEQAAPQITPIRHISGVSIIFDWGMAERGKSCGLYAQADVVDLYGYRVNEELEYENVRTHYVDTRRGKPRTDYERFAEVPAGFVPVILSADWHANTRQHNASLVEYHGDLFRFSKRICEALSDWGKTYVWGHRVSNPIVATPIKGREDQPFIRIKPFAPNGPHVAEYIRRMDKLGEEIGRAIGDFLRERGEGLRNR